MRLTILDNGHRLRARLFISATSVASRVEMSDVPKTLLYRPEFFGRAMLDLSASKMRGPSFWTAGEREYLAMFTARLHGSSYCFESHTEMVRIAATGEIDPSGDSARPELLAVLPFLQKVSLTPEQASLNSSLPQEAVVDALHVNLIWNVINRLANAFDFRLRDGQLLKGTRSLHRFGYRFPDFLVSGGKPRSDDPVADLRRSVFDSPGSTSLEMRRAAGSGDPLPELLAAYTATVRDHSDRVTDTDVAQLVSAGHTEDEIFELTVAAATGAALRSLDAGLGAVTH